MIIIYKSNLGNIFSNLGIVLSYGKADMKTFLKDLYPNLKSLEYGISVRNKHEQKDIKLYLLHAIFDKPARASSLNIVNSTGYYGCLKCRIKGLSIKTKSIYVSLLLKYQNIN